MAIIGRTEETAVLERAFASERAEMIAVYGRRRIGKTHLVTEFYRGKGAYVVDLVGQSGANMNTQLRNARRELTDVHGVDVDENDWGSVFHAIREIYRRFRQTNPETHFVVFIDEMPWIATPRSGFVGALGYAWNRHFDTDRHVSFVLCGSAAAWMIRNVAGDRGELHQRITRKIHMMPFTLHETEQYLRYKGFQIDRKKVVDYYIVLGGVAQYLNHLDPNRSFDQNINDLCFNTGGGLYNEFPQLFTSLFGTTGHHRRVVEVLGEHRTRRMLAGEIAERTHMNEAGVYKVLEELESAGFVRSHRYYNQRKRNSRYDLIDPYSHFYLKWIKGLSFNDIQQNPNYWGTKTGTQSWRSWSGNAFEMICHNHVPQIKKALDIAAVHTESYYWAKRGGAGETGAQIDLLLKRADRMVNIIECKYYSGAFTIDREYQQNLERKRASFMEADRQSNAVSFVMLTTFGAQRGPGVDLEYIDLTIDALFREL